jgi:hypothetical protein
MTTKEHTSLFNAYITECYTYFRIHLPYLLDIYEV